MRTRLLATLACWLSLTALVSAQPINPGAEVTLPTYTVPDKDAAPDEFGDPGKSANPTFFFGLEGLYWWTKPSNVDRPIVGTLGNPSEDYRSAPGAGSLSDPNTIVVYGNQHIDHDLRYGLRLTGQIGFDDMNADVVELVGMYLPRQTERSIFVAPALALLYNDVSAGFPGTQSAFPVAGLIGGTQVAGAVAIETRSELWGAECNFSHRFTPRGQPYFGELLFGYRHQGLAEAMYITAGQPNSGFEDSFKTTNFFNGGQVGARVGLQWWHLSAQASIKGAVGLTDQSLMIDSSTFGGANSALYAQLSNSGKFSMTRELGLVAEGTASVTWSITPNIAFSWGYDYLYWNRVQRATDQVDANINFNQTDRLSSPLPRQQRTEFWAQGATASLEFMF